MNYKIVNGSISFGDETILEENSNSNIIKFQQLFDITEGKNAIKDILNFVYDLQHINSYYDLPERTSLQSKIKDLLINEKEIHIGIGKLKKI